MGLKPKDSITVIIPKKHTLRKFKITTFCGLFVIKHLNLNTKTSQKNTCTTLVKSSTTHSYVVLCFTYPSRGRVFITRAVILGRGAARNCP